MMWYWEVMRLGKWSPRTSDTKPLTVDADGVKNPFRRLQEVPKTMQHLNLTEMQTYSDLVAKRKEKRSNG